MVGRGAMDRSIIIEIYSMLTDLRTDENQLLLNFIAIHMPASYGMALGG
jgi:hypothetical protein